MDEALKFFEKVIGREASPAEQRGEFGLDILLALIDARINPPVATPEKPDGGPIHTSAGGAA